ncbi:amino-acid N-acetyltransferase [Desulfonauticus submarinus]|uniref:Amino-acid N-acetyltransferase n=1 Tax=Desulfonauticus submarinus TaxID=206665 RepID=A0A1H0CHC2_9BACT|nr:N-acetyltransferase [Desulfonauticus submarinus]SDN57242.1 amino-acid N-acetyltransferase [Desulfonauticus submarinus]
MNSLYIRKARIKDVKAIHGLLMDYANEGLLLPRSYSELYSQLRDYLVLAERTTEDIYGCCALTIVWDNLAEVRSLAVRRDKQGSGWGRKLVEMCLSEAITLGIYKVFVLTYQKNFFAHLGFKVVDKNVLPQKVWADCLKCPKFPECDEIAMLIEM